MPQIQRRGIEGCCVSSNFYDLGGAHAKYRSKNLEEFALKMVSLGYTNFNIAITNQGQDVERKYLEELGFKKVWASKIRKDYDGERITLHAADNTVLDEKLAPYRTLLKQREEERKKKELEELQKKMASAGEALTKFFKERYPTLPEKVSATDVHSWLELFPYASVDTIAKSLLGKEADMSGFERRWSYDGEIARGFNTRLTTIHKRAEREAALKAAEQQPVVVIGDADIFSNPSTGNKTEINTVPLSFTPTSTVKKAKSGLMKKRTTITGTTIRRKRLLY